MVEHGCLDSAEAEIERVAPRFGRRESYRSGRICRRSGGEAIENRSARIAESEKFSNLVVGFACRVVAGLRDFFVGEGRLCGILRNLVENGVTARDDEAHGG